MKTKRNNQPRVSYWNFVKPNLAWLIAGPLAILIDGILEILQPRFMARIVDEGINATDLASGDRIRVILQNGGIMIALAVLAILCGIGGVYFTANGTFRFGASLRKALFSKVQSFSFSNIDRFSTASLVTRLTNDVTNIQNTMMMSLRMFTRTIVMLTGALISAILINRELALVTAFSIPVLGIAITVILIKGFPLFEKMQKHIDAINRRVQESVSNIRVIKSFVREDFERKRFNGSAKDLYEITVQASGLIVILMPIMTLIMNLTTVAVLWFGSQQVIEGRMLVGDLISYSTYILHILMSLMMMSFALMMFSRARASSVRLKEVLGTQPDITEKDGALTTPITRGEVEFRQVNFGYGKKEHEVVLSDISFTAKPGQTVAIVGATGSSKTTLVQMIPRLYDVDGGQVLVDGVDVRDYALSTLRSSIGMVLQTNVLFSGTIRENLLWGNENATEEELIQAAKDAQAYEFIHSFPDGFDTMLEQGGVNLSGGQKQRLCIARAILRKPPILILDDSTSAVDSDTESRIRTAFRERLNDTTIFIIAQRISSFRTADTILVLENGRLAGMGSYDELLQTNDIFQEIVRSQQKGVSA